MSNKDIIRHMIELLEKTRKTNSKFFDEYDISPSQVKNALIMNGFNQKWKDYLDAYVVDLTALACYYHALNTVSTQQIHLFTYVLIFTDGTNHKLSAKCKTTDCAWNMTIDEIISKLKTLL